MVSPMTIRDPVVWDVAICGGGLAGLTLARQLRRELPELSVVVLEKLPRPLPPAAFKVGESSVELSSHYFGSVLGLDGYLRKAHLPKLGLRFFFGDSQGPFSARPEFGEVDYPRLPSYQLDRGVLEEDLRPLIVGDGARLLEGCSIDDILLEGSGPHQILYRGPEGTARLRARWVIDAAGRRRLLQSKLGLKQSNGHRANAAWFRVPGRLDVDDLVPASEKAWHERVPGRRRYNSTNHLMGKGYWVWLIPLSSGITSIGIVADDKIHPFREYSTFEAARAWLKRHEPALDAYLGSRPVLDFRKLKQFSHSSSRVFSSDRWACTGEAGVFLDPFYSPGSDFIATSNTLICALIRLDSSGKLSAAEADWFNRYYLDLHDNMVEAYRDCYPIFGSARVMGAKIIWDTAFYWGCTAPIFFHGLLTRTDLGDRLSMLRKPLLDFNKRMQDLFRAWGSHGNQEPPAFTFTGICQFPFLWKLHFALAPARSAEAVLNEFPGNLSLLEDLALAIIRQAKSECGAKVGDAASAASPMTPSRNLERMESFLRPLFDPAGSLP